MIDNNLCTRTSKWNAAFALVAAASLAGCVTDDESLNEEQQAACPSPQLRGKAYDTQACPPPPPPERPNLVPIKLTSCAGPNAPIYFYVKNVGTAVAAASTVRFTPAPQLFSVPALEPGEASPTYGAPLYYAGGDASFTIEADFAHVIFESNEADNIYSGGCLGIASTPSF